MPGIKIVGKGFLDTQGVSFSGTLKSPVFRADNSDGSLIFTTTIPYTDTNKSILGFLARPEGFHNDNVDVNVEIYINGMHVWDGILSATLVTLDNGTNTGFEISIGIGRGEFNFLAEGKNIKDLMPDEMHVVGTTEQRNDPFNDFPYNYVNITGFNDVVNKKYPDVNFAIFPIKIEDFASSMGSAFQNWYNVTPVVNVWEMETQTFKAPFLSGNDFLLINTTVDENHDSHFTFMQPYNIFIPFAYNSWVFKNIFKSLGFFLKNNPFESDSDLNKLVIYNIQSINKLYTLNQVWPASVTIYEYFYALQPNLKFNLKDHLPNILVKDYIRALEDMFFFRCFFDNKSRTVTIKFLKDIINDKEYVDITKQVTGIKQRNLVFDKIMSLTQTYDSNDGLGGNFKTQDDIESFERIPDVWFKDNLPENTFGQYENKLCYAFMEDKFYKCADFADDFNHVSQWDFYAFGYYLKKTLLDTGKEFTAETASIACTYFFDFRPGTSFVKYEWFIPYCKQAIKFYNTHKTETNTCGLRLLFYRGMQSGKVDTTLPVEKIKIAEGKYNDCRAYVAAIHFDPSFVPTEITVLSTDYTYNPSLGSMAANYHLNSSVADYICVTILSGWLTVDDVRDQLNSIIGITETNHVFSTYCENFYVTPTEPNHIVINRYPLGTNDVYNAFGEKIPEANLSLKWDGKFGIYEKFAKPYIQWYNKETKPFTLFEELTPVLLNPVFYKKQRLSGNDNVIDEIRFNILPDDTINSEVDCWTV